MLVHLLTKGIENFIKVVQGQPALDEGLHTLVRTPDGLGNLIDILRLDHSLQVVFQQLGEII